MFQFWGDGSQLSKELVNQIVVRSTDNFNWTFIFILAVVFYVYWSELNKKNYDAVFAGLALYGVHWLYEIGNAVIGIQFKFQVFGEPYLLTDFASLVFGTIARVDESPHFCGGSFRNFIAVCLRLGGLLGHNHYGHKLSFF